MTDNEYIKTPAGVFWADHIKTLRDQPHLRLRYARDYFPAPSAFREAAVAIRALIRKARNTDGLGPLLSEFYLIAAQEAFLCGTPYISGIGPGFNVASQIDRATWEGLEMPYGQIGYEHLDLLNKTDRKRFREAWGEPEGHSRPQDYHNSVRDPVVEAVRQQNELEETRSWQRLDALLNSSPNWPPRRCGWVGSLLSRLMS